MAALTLAHSMYLYQIFLAIFLAALIPLFVIGGTFYYLFDRTFSAFSRISEKRSQAIEAIESLSYSTEGFDRPANDSLRGSSVIVDRVPIDCSEVNSSDRSLSSSQPRTIRRPTSINTQLWTIDTVQKLAIVFDRLSEERRVYQCYSSGVVFESSGEKFVHLTLTHPMIAHPGDVSQLRQRSYFRFTDPQWVELRDGILEFESRQTIVLPEDGQSRVGRRTRDEERVVGLDEGRSDGCGKGEVKPTHYRHDCKFYATNSYLRCAVNPIAGCEGCSSFEGRG